MTTSIRALIGATVLIAVIVTGAPAAVEMTDGTPQQRLLQNRTYMGKPLTYWLQVLRDRNEEMISYAFDAIHSLGDDAWIAVPDLSRLVAAPFAPVRIGSDSRELIASKVVDITIRTEAIETLAWIGAPATPSTTALVEWAVMPRVVVGPLTTHDDLELFIELVTLDAEQRMRVAGAVAEFGPDASIAIAGLLTSSEAAKRKIAVAILSQDALPIAAELLRSNVCDDRKLGLLILKDMDLIVAQPYLDELAKQIRENCLILSKLQ